MIAADWLGWGQLSYTEQLTGLSFGAAFLAAYLALKAMFGWLFTSLPARVGKAKARRKKRKKTGRR